MTFCIYKYCNDYLSYNHDANIKYEIAWCSFIWGLVSHNDINKQYGDAVWGFNTSDLWPWWLSVIQRKFSSVFQSSYFKFLLLHYTIKLLTFMNGMKILPVTIYLCWYQLQINYFFQQ